jgi:phosphoribosyl 1,2-cyclic phosphate phosphodiesterase
MKLKYFGTGAAEGIPALFCDCDICKRSAAAGGKNLRTRSQALIDDKLLVDFPPDTGAHVLFGGLSPVKIDYCLVTHSHHDHLYTDDLRMIGEAYSTGRKRPFKIFAAEEVCSIIEQSLSRDNIIEDQRIILVPVKPFQSFKIDDYTVIPLKARHRNLPGALIYIIENAGKRLLYAHDTGWLHDETWEFLEKTRLYFDCVSFDCTGILKSPDNQTMKSHMNLPTVSHVRKKMIEFGCLDEKTLCILSHFSHNGKMTHDDLTGYLQGSPYIAAYDGMEMIL